MLYDQNEHYISCKCFFENMSDINVNTHTHKKKIMPVCSGSSVHICRFTGKYKCKHKKCFADKLKHFFFLFIVQNVFAM